MQVHSPGQRENGSGNRGAFIMDGLWLLDKPKGLTSHQAVNELARLLGEKRAGHTGTLDPMATGLLICCLGRATRLSEYLIRADKTYEGEMTLGATSNTFDADGEIAPTGAPLPESPEAIRAAFEKMLGEIEQQAPAFSALKVAGRRLYELAREGRPVNPPKRKVTIKSLALRRYEPPRAAFTTRVSSGAYVRSICHDVGRMLGCGAYLSALRRTRVGYYSVEDALTLEAAAADPAAARRRLIPLHSALKHLPRVVLTREGLTKFLHGNTLNEEDIKEFLLPRFGPHLPIQVVDRSRFYGIMERKKIFTKPSAPGVSGNGAAPGAAKPYQYYKPVKVFPPEGGD
ncbi:MAG: hypothetical protein Kow0059_20840 [Candidatus Sumerlaeia bacterium]